MRPQPLDHDDSRRPRGRDKCRCAQPDGRAANSLGFVRRATVCAILIASAGCAGQSNFLTGAPTVGQLKTSLSHVEYENEQLKRSVAKLEQQSRSLEDRLVQEQLSNGDLTARLDDARNVLRDRGLDTDVRLGARSRAGLDDGSVDDDVPRARTLPTGRGVRQRRKPPFAQISSPLKVLPPIDADDVPPTAAGSGTDAKSSRSKQGRDDILDHHSYHAGPFQWLPVAGATGDPAIQVR